MNQQLIDILEDFVLVGLPKDCAMVNSKIIAPERKKLFTENRNKQYAKAVAKLNKYISEIIGEDEVPIHVEISSMKDAQAQAPRLARNELKAEQRKRAGITVDGEKD